MSTIPGRLKHFLSIPTFSTSEENHQARLLGQLSLALFVTYVLVLITAVLSGTQEIAFYLNISLLVPLLLLSWGLLKKKQVKRACAVFVYGVWGYLTLLLVLSDPRVVHVNFSVYYITIISAAVLVGARGALGIGLASAAVGGLLFYLEATGWPFEPMAVFNPIRNSIVSLLFLLLAATYTIICARTLYAAFQLITSEGKERELSEQALRNERDLVKALTEASTAVSGSLVFEEVLDSIMEQISKVIPSDAVNIMLIEGEKARIVRWRGYKQFGAEQNVADKVFQINDTPNLKYMRDKGEPIGAANTANSPNWVRSQDFSWLQSYVGAPIKVKERVVGFLNVDSARPDFYSPDQLVALQAFAGQIAVTVENTQLFSQVQQYADQLENAFLETTLALAKTLDVRDTYTADHSELISKRAEKTMRALGGSERDVMQISLAAKLHDIGKIGITDQILHKAGPLDDAEWKLMRKHPQIGGEIVRRVKGLEEVAEIIEAHQEKYDGSGYPLGLRGEAIPFKARIVSVVDAYGAMTENRVYRKVKTHAEAVAELKKESGKLFDPRVVKAFLVVIEEEVG